MKKVGLVTAYRIDNYGTKLQAYAMIAAIREAGYEVEIIDYFPAYDCRPMVVFKKVFNKAIHFLSCNKFDSRRNEEYTKIRHNTINQFDDLLNRSAPIKGYKNLKQIVKSYDAFVCGSDQIWSEGNLITDFYNLNFVEQRKPTIAYAPSFGASKISNRNIKRYKKFLNAINFLSVREDTGVKIIQQLTGRIAKQVIDPTLLVERRVWDNLLKSEKNSNILGEDYIFCYFLGASPHHRVAVHKLSEELQMKVVCLPHMKQYVQADDELPCEQLYDVSPIEFIRLIKNASYVCTDSFHGTVFSIIYEKRFFTFERFKCDDTESTNTRIYSLLQSLGLTDRLIADAVDITLCNIEYQNIREKLERLRTDSKKYLHEALSICSRKEL